MLATWSAIATPASATLMLVLLSSTVVLVIVALVALGVTPLVATFGPALLRGLGNERSGSGGRLGGRSGDKSRGVIGAALSWRRRRFVPA